MANSRLRCKESIPLLVATTISVSMDARFIFDDKAISCSLRLMIWMIEVANLRAFSFLLVPLHDGVNSIRLVIFDFNSALLSKE